jgi:hypothetical protein
MRNKAKAHDTQTLLLESRVSELTEAAQAQGQASPSRAEKEEEVQERVSQLALLQADNERLNRENESLKSRLISPAEPIDCEWNDEDGTEEDIKIGGVVKPRRSQQAAISKELN